VAQSDGNQPFQRIATPFPGYVVASHPRCELLPTARYMPRPDSCHLRPAPTTSISAATPAGIGRQPTQPATRPWFIRGASARMFKGSALTIRTGPQFSFDVGAALRGAATRSACSIPAETRTWAPFVQVQRALGLTSCANLSGWRLGTSGANEQPVEAFNPDLVWRERVSVGCPRPGKRRPYTALDKPAALDLSWPSQPLGYADGQAFTIPGILVQNTPVVPIPAAIGVTMTTCAHGIQQRLSGVAAATGCGL